MTEVTHPLLEDYVGIKRISACPMTRHDWLVHSGKPVPDDSVDVDGYMVKYDDSHVSWSPKAVFEGAYKSSGHMTYAMALFMVQTFSHQGAVIYREGWNGKNMYVTEIDSETLAQGINRNYGDPSNPDNNPEHCDTLFLKNAQGKLFSWFPSTGDQNATDWCVKYL